MTLATYDNAKARFWGEFVNVAYRMFDDNPNNPNPPQPSYFPYGWRLWVNLIADEKVPFFSEKALMGFFTYKVSDPSQVGIVFRGTDSIWDWIKDGEFLLDHFRDIPHGGRVEHGFLSVYNNLSIAVPGTQQRTDLKTFSTALIEGNQETLCMGGFPGEGAANLAATITGHSLGGALAILQAIVVASRNLSLVDSVYTFAAPEVGNMTFKHTFDEKLATRHYRIYNEPDWVPALPGWELGFHQVETGIRINSLAFPKIKHSVGCYHSLLTYLYVLGDRDLGLGNCQK